MSSSTILSEESKNNIHLVYPVNNHSKLFCMCLFSALINNYPPPKLVNYGQKMTFEEGQAKKISGFKSLLESLPKNDTVIFVDAFDLFFQLPLDIMMLRYRDTKKTLFSSADKWCWPNYRWSDACEKIPKSSLPADIYGPDTDLPYGRAKNRPRFFNSGGMIGQARQLKTLFKSADIKMAALKEPPITDQGLLAEVFQVNYEKRNWGLDYESSIFQTVTNSIADIMWPEEITESTLSSAPLSPQPYMKKIDLRGLGFDDPESPWPDRWLAWNRVSNSVPVILHYNGKEGKSVLEKSWQRMWWYPDLIEMTEELAKNEKAGVWADGKWIQWKEICGTYDLT
ncbi:hypothetical protein PROFUN_03069 [Planoprotostelium fungivorum]|uniref:PLOD1-3-like GT domain-containing protein n=1 Tax=Planoprotostelium fungivorum TaxID=1890364 RepID=A0A2P6NQ47_9EUKA|nr:hypothetical protein PROFUN_03069 [Planoprotostelium fungivorum]